MNMDEQELLKYFKELIYHRNPVPTFRECLVAARLIALVQELYYLARTANYETENIMTAITKLKKDPSCCEKMLEEAFGAAENIRHSIPSTFHK